MFQQLAGISHSIVPAGKAVSQRSEACLTRNHCTKHSHNVARQSFSCGEQLGMHDLQLADVSIRVGFEDEIDHDLHSVQGEKQSARAGS